MLNVKFTNISPSAFQTQPKIQPSPKNITSNYQSEKIIPFKGNIDFVLVNKCAQKLPINKEFKHIEDVLKTIGVTELELGDNIGLARLLKSAMCRVKKMGFEVPKKIICDAKFFKNDPEIQALTKEMSKKLGITDVSVPAHVRWDSINEPIMYFNPEKNWNDSRAFLSNTKDLRYSIWHETGHYLHIKNFKNNPNEFWKLTQKQLSEYQQGIVRESIGKYAADTTVAETIAETFSRLMSGESYSKLHPEVFYIYNKYNGPMPKLKV